MCFGRLRGQRDLRLYSVYSGYSDVELYQHISGNEESEPRRSLSIPSSSVIAVGGTLANINQRGLSSSTHYHHRGQSGSVEGGDGWL
jgi:hypothetical protein